MFRTPALRIGLLVIALGAAGRVPARASGAWTVHIRMKTCTDLLALPDTVWLASAEAGLLRYDRATGTIESVTHAPDGLASNSVAALAVDRGGRLWVGTNDHGVSRLSTSGTWDLVNAFDGLPSDSVNVLRADGDTIWIGTTQGIALWNGTVIAGSVPDIGTPSPFADNNVTGIVVLGDTLFVGTDDGIYLARLSQNLATWSEADAGVSDKQIVRLAASGRSAFALSNGAVYLWNEGAGTWSSVAPPGSYVKNLRDDWGTLLAATQDSTCVWTGAGWRALAGAPTCDTSVPGDVEMGADPAGHVFATRAGTLREQAAGAWPVTEPPGPVGDDEFNILYHDGLTWVCSNEPGGGMSRFDGSTWRLWPSGCCGAGQDTSFVESAFGFALQADRQDRIWTAQWDNAIERIDPVTQPYAFDHVFVARGIDRADTLSRHSDGWSTAVDSSGFVYIGGDTPNLGGGANWDPMGIDVYDTSGVRVINWKTTNANLRGNQVRAISVDPHGVMWVGFALGGVRHIRLSDTGPGRETLPYFRPVAPLESKPIFGVVAHGDSIWVLTTSDLERVRGTDSTIAATLDLPAGAAIVPTGAVHPLDVAVDGTVWVGTTSGVRMFSPGGAVQDFDVDNSPLPNNYVTAVFCEPGRTAVWFATSGGVARYDPQYVAPAPPRLPALRVRAFPNPALLNGLGTILRIEGNATRYDGEVLDLGGRVVRRFSGVANGDVAWDGRDGDGVFVRPGVYFLHVTGGGREGAVRVVVLR